MEYYDNKNTLFTNDNRIIKVVFLKMDALISFISAKYLTFLFSSIKQTYFIDS